MIQLNWLITNMHFLCNHTNNMKGGHGGWTLFSLFTSQISDMLLKPQCLTLLLLSCIIAVSHEKKIVVLWPKLVLWKKSNSTNVVSPEVRLLSAMPYIKLFTLPHQSILLKERISSMLLDMTIESAWWIRTCFPSDMEAIFQDTNRQFREMVVLPHQELLSHGTPS